MKIVRSAIQLGYPLIGFLILTSIWPSRALAQHAQTHTSTSPNQELTEEQKRKAGALVKVVREATERYRDVEVAKTDDYELLFGCVTGPDAGAMGMHFANLSLVFDDGVLDPARPEIVIYEPMPNGRLKLIGADYLVPAEAWHAKNGPGTPEIMGQLLHFFEAPNRFGLPPFYTLHVWAWKENPNGMFVNWHPNVSCDAFAGSGH